MLSLKEILTLSDQEINSLLEVLDLGGVDDPFDEKSTEFSFDDCKYKCEFRMSMTENNKTILEFKFFLTDGPNKPNPKNFSSEQQYKVALSRWSIGIVGVKHPLKALQNALSSLKNAINSKKTDFVSFTANEENRQRLYRKFFERYNHLIPNYEICSKNPITGDDLSSEEFWLERK